MNKKWNKAKEKLALALAAAGCTTSQIALELGVSRVTLYEKLRSNLTFREEFLTARDAGVEFVIEQIFEDDVETRKYDENNNLIEIRKPFAGNRAFGYLNQRFPVMPPPARSPAKHARPTSDTEDDGLDEILKDLES